MKKVLGLVLIIIVGIVFGFSSYAWLSPKNNNIDKIDINISSKVLVSTDSKDFKNILERKDIIDGNGIISKDFYQVSTTLSKDEVKFFETKNNEVEEILEKDGYYTVFDLYFKTDKEETIYLTDKTNIIYKGDNPEVKDSIRIGFNNIIYEPNYDTHTVSSINNAYTTNHLYLKEKNSKKQPYKAINKNKELESVDTTDSLELNLGRGITKVKVYIWIESNDIDAYKELTGESIKYILDFEIKK